MIFLDAETETNTDSGFFDLSKMKVTFVGAYDDKHDKFYSFWRENLSELGDLIKSADRVVGYNIVGFDYAVLTPEFKDVEFWKIPTLDLMVAMKNHIGFRPKLDDMARANLGRGKIGHGLDAGEYWRNGEYDKLEKYCLEDVRLTYEVWHVGENDRRVKYYDRNGFLKETPIDWTQGYFPRIIPPTKVVQPIQDRLL